MVLARPEHAEEMAAVTIESIAATRSCRPRQSASRRATATAAASPILTTMRPATASSTGRDRTDRAPLPLILERLPPGTTTSTRAECARRME